MCSDWSAGLHWPRLPQQRCLFPGFLYQPAHTGEAHSVRREGPLTWHSTSRHVKSVLKPQPRPWNVLCLCRCMYWARLCFLWKSCCKTRTINCSWNWGQQGALKSFRLDLLSRRQNNRYRFSTRHCSLPKIRTGKMSMKRLNSTVTVVQLGPTLLLIEWKKWHQTDPEHGWQVSGEQ